MKRKTMIGLAMMFPLMSLADIETDRKYLVSSILWIADSIDDDLTDEEIDQPQTPFSKRDAIKEYFAGFLKHDGQSAGWTTNQLISEIIRVYSNTIDAAVAGDAHKEKLAGLSLCALGSINHSNTWNFLSTTLTNDARVVQLAADAIPGIFRYSHLEPEIMRYMRSICVNTNLYAEESVCYLMFMKDCLKEMPQVYRASAKTNLASFCYYTLSKLPMHIGYTDSEIVGLFPEYANSRQRLAAMRYISQTATNVLEREGAMRELNRLNAIPTNELNDVRWIVEEN